MNQRVGAWRTSWAIVVLITLLGIATQVVQSQGRRQTKTLGIDRLVSIERLPNIQGQVCEFPADPVTLMAMAQPQSRPSPSALAATPRPSDAARAEVARRQPASTIKDAR